MTLVPPYTLGERSRELRGRSRLLAWRVQRLLARCAAALARSQAQRRREADAPG